MKKFKNIELLNQMIEEKLVMVQTHPTLDLFIYNYSQKCQFEKIWNEVTLQCRGLILNSDGFVIAMPLKKFFNAEEVGTDEIDEMMRTRDYKIWEKADGSLGILWKYKGEFGIATRGSFTSDQSVWATKFMEENYMEDVKKLDTDNFTYLFEIIYPENRIVIDYKGESMLKFITKVNKETGISVWNHLEYFEEVKNFSVVKNYAREPFRPDTFERLKAQNMKNREGYVIQFDNDHRIKIKFEDYIKIHRVVTNVTARSIWDILRNGGDLSEWMDFVPDEFFNWVREKEEEFKNEHSLMIDKAHELYKMILDSLDEGFVKKDFALAVKATAPTKYQSLLFSLYEGRAISGSVWALLRPEHEKPFSTSGKIEE